ncbi:hypothetical protein BRADI_1g34162v3 [Brachypodium distachyon]|uniref:Uncharacterized protein n=1 Tax=Brachypodium distachyon TaxID=15368 RepID=A0A2K2DMN6_BRADI|nr:hypothetical protein BRADI_1g34162v3 [Brachypodium distachyon]
MSRSYLSRCSTPSRLLSELYAVLVKDYAQHLPQKQHTQLSQLPPRSQQRRCDSLQISSTREQRGEQQKRRLFTVKRTKRR